jgi:hypothetical protein
MRWLNISCYMTEGDDVVCNCVLMFVVQRTPSVQVTPLVSRNRNNRIIAYTQRELGILRSTSTPLLWKTMGPLIKHCCYQTVAVKKLYVTTQQA